jgi:hypothetical protein
MTERAWSGVAAEVSALAAEVRAGKVDVDGRVREALRGGDWETATQAMVAQVVAGAGRPRAEDVARVLPRLERLGEFLALVAALREQVCEVLVQLCGHERFARDAIGYSQWAIALAALHRFDGPRPPLIASLRQLAREPLLEKKAGRAAALLVALAADLGDAHLAALAKPWEANLDEAAEEDAVEIERSLEESPLHSLDGLESLPPLQLAPLTRKTTTKVGRNDPCPCGSGQKYKKCHGAGGADAAAPTEEGIDAAEVKRLPETQLLPLDPAKLRTTALAALVEQLMLLQHYDEAEAALAALAARPDAGEQERQLRAELLAELTMSGQLERARRHLPLTDRSRIASFALELELAAPGADRWAILEREALTAITDERGIAAVDLAYGMMHASPAVAVLLGRACLAFSTRANDLFQLLDEVERARDQLAIAPEDPAWDVLAALVERPTDKEPKPDAREVQRLRGALRALEAEKERLQRELRQRIAVAAPVSTETVDQAELRRLRAKVAELEALIREGNEQRLQLRQQLRMTMEQTNPTPAPRREEPLPDDEGESVEESARAPALPTFSARATSSLAEVPSRIAADALRLVGELCAGDPAAWRGVKQAKDMPRPLLMARIGIHYRLLFVREATALELLDVVPREGLDAALKRFRTHGP